MKVIGVTGGVGAGKTKILTYIKERYHCRTLLADEAAKALQEPGQVCHDRLVSLLGSEIVREDGRIAREKMAEKIFGNRELLQSVNEIIHPAVRDYIVQEIEEERNRGGTDFFFLEAALLIECGYTEIVEEMWYIYTEESVRRERLRRGRNYTDEKIDSIVSSQLSDEVYRKHCSFVLDNSGEIARVYEQIDKKMGEYLWKR